MYIYKNLDFVERYKKGRFADFADTIKKAFFSFFRRYKKGGDVT